MTMRQINKTTPYKIKACINLKLSHIMEKFPNICLHTFNSLINRFH